MTLSANTKETSKLAHCFDAFEIELKYVESLIDMLYQLPRNHDYAQKTLEDLHTHRLNMRETYDKIRDEIMMRSF